MATIVALVRDLMFSSRILATARAMGVEARVLRDPAQLQSEEAVRLLLDLHQPGAIEAASAWRAAAPGRLAIGFFSHVDADTAARARAAGIDVALPRSAFVQRLESLLADDLGEPE